MFKHNVRIMSLLHSKLCITLPCIILFAVIADLKLWDSITMYAVLFDRSYIVYRKFSNSHSFMIMGMIIISLVDVWHVYSYCKYSHYLFALALMHFATTQMPAGHGYVNEQLLN